jgi:hypothetical protein
MTFDYEEWKQKKQEEEQKEDAERKERREKNRAEIAALATDLERILTNPSPHLSSLERQGDLLDCLLYTIMRRNLHTDKNNGYFDQDNVEFALRIQKQYVETVKAAGAIAYMQSIASYSTGIYPPLPFPAVPPPPPHKHDEQTE